MPRKVTNRAPHKDRACPSLQELEVREKQQNNVLSGDKVKLIRSKMYMYMYRIVVVCQAHIEVVCRQPTHDKCDICLNCASNLNVIV